MQPKRMSSSSSWLPRRRIGRWRIHSTWSSSARAAAVPSSPAVWSTRGASVCVIEAGGARREPGDPRPGRLWELWVAPDDWAYTPSRRPGATAAGCDLPRGKVLGGSSCLNGMIYIRGHRSDYDAWAATGCDGLGLRGRAAALQALRGLRAAASREYHGAGGPLRVTADYEPHPLHAAAVEAAQEVGIPFNDDHNGADPGRRRLLPADVEDGMRQSADRRVPAAGARRART